ncbi:MAG: hypothetical protein H6736_19070, partial [Alphaproteobacteria bacterium]|nr:hypothetical protein [Alphaproteobacteria bacterium]
TSKAIRLIDILDRAKTPALSSPRLTGEWEHALKEVENGQRGKDEMYREMVGLTKDLVENLKGFDHNTLFADMPPVGVCPECGGKVSENALGYFCEHNLGRDEGCIFAVWKEVRGRYMDRRLVSELLEKRDLPDVEGFVGFSGESQTATMHLVKKALEVKKGKETVEEDRWVVDLEYGPGQGGRSKEPEVEEGVLMPCPQFPESEIVVTNHRWVSRKVFEGDEKKGPMLPRTVCQRELSEDEARAYFGDEARTEILDGFISKRGRPFRGALIRKDTGKHGFEFPPREPRGGAASEDGEAPKKPAAKKPTKGAAAKKGAATKKTTTKAPTKPAAKKGSTAKKASTAKASTAKKATGTRKTTARKAASDDDGAEAGA